MKYVRYLIILVCICVIAVASWQIFSIEKTYSENESAYEQLEALVSVPETQATRPPRPSSPDAQEPEEPEVPFPEVDFDALAEINPDVVGWITIPDTVINYPIAQAGNNDYYLKHLFTRQENAGGCIFLDASNMPDFSDWNNILYGHNMRNGSMFACLNEYKNQPFYNDHPTGQLITPNGNYTIEFFSGYVLSGWGDAWTVSFSDDADFDSWLMTSKSKSMFESPIMPTPEDRIVTLSTCTYEFDDARFVLLGILQEEARDENA